MGLLDNNLGKEPITDIELYDRKFRFLNIIGIWVKSIQITDDGFMLSVQYNPVMKTLIVRKHSAVSPKYKYRFDIVKIHNPTLTDLKLVLDEKFLIGRLR